MIRVFVFVSGPPASGKSTIASQLGPALGLPVIAKDVIKEALMDVLGVPDDVAASRQLGRAAVTAMLALARQNDGAVLDSVWLPYTRPLIAELPAPRVEVHCRLPLERAQQRYRRRISERHAGHLGDQRPDEDLWDAQLRRPLGLGPVIAVDTSGRVDIGQLADQVRAVASADR